MEQNSTVTWLIQRVGRIPAFAFVFGYQLLKYPVIITIYLLFIYAYCLLLGMMAVGIGGALTERSGTPPSAFERIDLFLITPLFGFCLLLLIYPVVIHPLAGLLYDTWQDYADQYPKQDDKS